MTDNKCGVCQNLATQRCAGCQNIFYCSREHQKQHWKQHKSNCNPFKVCKDDIMGRCLIATRDIKPGEILLREKPLISGPAQMTPPVCLGCNKGLVYGEGKDCVACSKCGWPVCNEKCENSNNHKPECDFTSKRGYKIQIQNFTTTHPSYQCLTVLRCLYQRDHNPEIWSKLLELESHEKERKDTVQYEQDKVTAQFILKFFKLEDKFTEEEILKVAGIVQVNAHEIPLTEPQHVAIYEKTSLLEHNCRANCSKSFTSKGEVLIAAGIPIKAGERVKICYVDPLWGTANRRHFLLQTKFFSCNCERCKDPTEFGTMFSALKCQKGTCNGYLLPKSFVDENNADGLGTYKQLTWHCNKCHDTKPEDSIQETLERVGRDLDAMRKGDIGSCQKFLDYYGKVLHTSHYYMTDVRMALGQMIGQKNKLGLTGVTDDEVNLKAKSCQQVSDLLLQLIPAETRIRGTLLFELHAAIAEIGRRGASKGQMGPDSLEIMLLESKRILSEASQLLKHEPDVLPEGKIAIQAKKNLIEMDTLLKSIHSAVGDTP